MNDVLKNKINNIQESPNTFLNFFDHSDDGMVLVDRNGIVREWSSGYERITGLTKESVIGKMHIWDAAELAFPYKKRPREECERMKADLKDVIASMEQTSLVRYVRHTKTGEYRTFNVLYFPVETPEGMMIGGISRDVTDETKYREQLEENERKLEFLVKERTDELEAANEELCASNEELYASNDELYKYRTQLEEMVEEKTSEVVAKQKDLEVLSRRQEILIKVLKIIQSGKNLPEAINVSLAKIGEYTGVSRVYIFEKSNDGNTISCTYEWRDTDITSIKDKFQNVPVQKLQAWFDIFDTSETLSASDINTLNPKIVEILNSCGVKSIIDLPLSTNGDNYGFVGFDDCNTNREWEQNEVELLKSLSQIISSATYRYQAEQKLIRAKEKAEEADKLKSAFLANMSHEIRTPLNGITGFLRFLASDNLSQERKHQYIDVINNSSMQLVKLIDDIIDVAKIEAKQLDIFPVPVHINKLMKELQIFFEAYLQVNKKEHMILLLDDSKFLDNCVALIDPVRLRQVLSNLIGNAIKFTEKGYIRFGYRQSAPDQLEFVVEDTGIGLAPEQHKVIFERFRQAELNTNRLYGGTGLGLNIASNLVQLMGGDIRVESTEGAGSSFFFTVSYLPVAEEN